MSHDLQRRLDGAAIYSSDVTSLHLTPQMYAEVVDTVKAGLPCLTMTDSLDTSRQPGERYLTAYKDTIRPNA